MKKPYEKLHKEGLTDYYILSMDDRDYLAFDSKDIIEDPNMNIFRRIFKGSSKEITTGVKLLPISGAIMYLLTVAIGLGKTGDRQEMFDESLDVYETIDEVGNKDVISRLKELIEMTGVDNFMYNFPVVPKNNVAKAYRKDGFNFMYVEEMNTLHRTYYLYRTNIYGFLQLVKIDESGKKGEQNITTSVENYMFSRDLMMKVLLHGGFDQEDIENKEGDR